MKLAIVQLTASDISDYEETLRHISDMTEKACLSGADLLLLPECAYPAYFIGMDESRASLAGCEKLLTLLAGLAERHSVYIAAGLALPEDGLLYNAAVVFDRSGKRICTAYKSNLWHFDHKWFAPGMQSAVFDSEFGKIGMMICADGRIPEIARMLRLRGAGLILDPVNLVASASAPQELTNQQYQFILQTRALENGVYLAVCNKSGVESNCITYIGRSFIASSDGRILAEAAPDSEEILLCELELPVSLKPLLRRPELYGELCRPTAETAAGQAFDTTLPLKELECFTSVSRFVGGTRVIYLEKARETLRRCALMDARLTVLPPPAAELGVTEKDIIGLSDCLTVGAAVVAIPMCGGMKALFFTGEGLIGELCQTHGCMGENRIETLSLFPGCCVAALFCNELEIPEIARVAMLKGADLLLWFDYGEHTDYRKLMQTRAAENKCFVLRSAGCEEEDYSLIVNPEGAVICSTFRCREQTASAMIFTALSRAKEVVPGTNIITGRIPERYKEMVE